MHTATPAQEYSRRVPSPPRVVIPALRMLPRHSSYTATANDTGTKETYSHHGAGSALATAPDTTISNGQVHMSGPSPAVAAGFTNTAFLHALGPYTHSITAAQSNTAPVLSIPSHAATFCEWKYTDRRHAQLILPFLMLGPSTMARDHEWLRREGVTMCLAVRATSAPSVLVHSTTSSATTSDESTDQIDFKTLGIPTGPPTGHFLLKAFPQGIAVINEHLSRVYTARLQQHQQQQHSPPHSPPSPVHSLSSPLGKVYVYCETGNERSASLVVAYIMAVFGADLVRAVQHVQTHRFAVNLDSHLRQTLLTYQHILQATRDVYPGTLERAASTTPVESALGEASPSLSLDSPQAASGPGEAQPRRRSKRGHSDISISHGEMDTYMESDSDQNLARYTSDHDGPDKRTREYSEGRAGHAPFLTL